LGPETVEGSIPPPFHRGGDANAMHNHGFLFIRGTIHTGIKYFFSYTRTGSTQNNRSG